MIGAEDNGVRDMVQICGALCLLIVELLIEYFGGAMLTKILLKKEGNAGMNLLTGFVAYQVLFQIFALGIVCTTKVLHHLSILWIVSLSILVPLSIWYGRNIFSRQIYEIISFIKKNKGICVVGFVVVLVFLYFICINGEINEDSSYYIGLIATSVQTDTLFQYNAYTGMEMESFYLRRALSTFEIHSAVLCQVLKFHPLILARIFRASQNVLLTSVAVMMCGKTVFWKDQKDGMKKAVLTVMVFWILQLPFAHTIYTPARFLLYRAYEAKAFAANVVVLFGGYLCVKVLQERNIGYIILLGIYLWGSIAMSTSAAIVAAVTCGIMLIPNLVQEKLYAGK